MNVRKIENLHPNGQRVRAALDAAGVTGQIIETLESSPTAATAAAQLEHRSWTGLQLAHLRSRWAAAARAHLRTAQGRHASAC